MPVAHLLVEGRDVDAVIFAAICAGNPVVAGGCSKGSLAPRARDRRNETGTAVCYVRDRDFDFMAPADLTQPTVDATIPGGAVLGWRWCRHEIENYLIDPGIVEAALGWNRAAFEAEIVNAAQVICHYQAARWAVGQSRQVLPPARDFSTKPPECDGHEFRLPADITQGWTAGWALVHAAAFVGSVQGVIGAPAMTARLVNHASQLTPAFL